MTQDTSQHAYNRLQDRPTTAPSGHGASQGRPREAKIAPKPKENQCFWPSRLFASDGLLRPPDGPKMAQESPKRGPREAQDGPKSDQEGPKRRLFGPRRGGPDKCSPLFCSIAPKMAPRDLQTSQGSRPPPCNPLQRPLQRPCKPLQTPAGYMQG